MGDLSSSPTLVALIPTATLLPVLILGLPGRRPGRHRRPAQVAAGHAAVDADVGRCPGGADAARPRDPDRAAGSHVCDGERRRADGPGVAGDPARSRSCPRSSRRPSRCPASRSTAAGRSVPRSAAALVAAAGPGWAFVVNAASFLGTAVVLWRWRPTRSAVRLPAESLSGALRAGWRYGANAPLLRAVMVRTAAFAIPAAAIQALLPAVVRDRLAMGSGGFGLMLGLLRHRRGRGSRSCARASMPRCRPTACCSCRAWSLPSASSWSGPASTRGRSARRCSSPARRGRPPPSPPTSPPNGRCRGGCGPAASGCTCSSWPAASRSAARSGARSPAGASPPHTSPPRVTLLLGMTSMLRWRIGTRAGARPPAGSSRPSRW